MPTMFDSIQKKLEARVLLEPKRQSILHIDLAEGYSAEQADAFKILDEKFAEEISSCWPGNLLDKRDGAKEAEIRIYCSSGQGSSSQFAKSTAIYFNQSIPYPQRLYYVGQILNWLQEQGVLSCEKINAERFGLDAAIMEFAKKPRERADEYYLADYLDVEIANGTCAVGVPQACRLGGFDNIATVSWKSLNYFARQAYHEILPYMRQGNENKPEIVLGQSTVRFSTYHFCLGEEEGRQAAKTMLVNMNQKKLLRQDKFAELLQAVDFGEKSCSTPRPK